jgi:DNA-binding Lrp family transcriptional regulator
MSAEKGGGAPEVDDLDLQLIRHLLEDGRTPFAQLAKQLNISEATVHARVAKLEEYGVIRGFTVIVDPEKLGYSLTALVLIKTDPKRTHHVFSRLTEMQEVIELYDVTGDYYGVAKVLVRDHHELGRFLDKIGLLDGVTSTNTLVVLRKVKETNIIKVGY